MAGSREDDVLEVEATRWLPPNVTGKITDMIENVISDKEVLRNDEKLKNKFSEGLEEIFDKTSGALKNLAKNTKGKLLTCKLPKRILNIIGEDFYASLDIKDALAHVLMDKRDHFIADTVLSGTYSTIVEEKEAKEKEKEDDIFASIAPSELKDHGNPPELKEMNITDLYAAASQNEKSEEKAEAIFELGNRFKDKNPELAKKYYMHYLKPPNEYITNENQKIAEDFCKIKVFRSSEELFFSMIQSFQNEKLQQEVKNFLEGNLENFTIPLIKTAGNNIIISTKNLPNDPNILPKEKIQEFAEAYAKALMHERDNLIADDVLNGRYTKDSYYCDNNGYAVINDELHNMLAATSKEEINERIAAINNLAQYYEKTNLEVAKKYKEEADRLIEQTQQKTEAPPEKKDTSEDLSWEEDWIPDWETGFPSKDSDFADQDKTQDPNKKSKEPESINRGDFNVKYAEADGNCAFNAFTLALANGHVLKKIEKNINPDKEFSRFIALAKEHGVIEEEEKWSDLKDKLLYPDDEKALQKSFGPVFRILAIDTINGHEAFKKEHLESTSAVLNALFHEYMENTDLKSLKDKDDCYFLQHDFIENKFQELKNESGKEKQPLSGIKQAKALSTWWKEEGHKKYLEALKKPAKDVNQEDRYGSEQELHFLGRYFNLDVNIWKKDREGKYQKAAAHDFFYGGFSADLINLSPEDKQYLIRAEIIAPVGSKDAMDVDATQFQWQEDFTEDSLRSKLSPIKDYDSIIKIFTDNGIFIDDLIGYYTVKEGPFDLNILAEHKDKDAIKQLEERGIIKVADHSFTMAHHTKGKLWNIDQITAILGKDTRNRIINTWKETHRTPAATINLEHHRGHWNNLIDTSIKHDEEETPASIDAAKQQTFGSLTVEDHDESKSEDHDELESEDRGESKHEFHHGGAGSVKESGRGQHGYTLLDDEDVVQTQGKSTRAVMSGKPKKQETTTRPPMTMGANVSPRSMEDLEKDIKKIKGKALRNAAKLALHYIKRADLALGSWGEFQDVAHISLTCQNLKSQLNSLSSHDNTDVNDIMTVGKVCNLLRGKVKDLDKIANKEAPASIKIYSDNLICPSNDPETEQKIKKAIEDTGHKPPNDELGADCFYWEVGPETHGKDDSIPDTANPPVQVLHTTRGDKRLSMTYLPDEELENHDLLDLVIKQIENFRADPYNSKSTIHFESGFSPKHLEFAISYCHYKGYDYCIDDSLKREVEAKVKSRSKKMTSLFKTTLSGLLNDKNFKKTSSAFDAAFKSYQGYPFNTISQEKEKTRMTEAGLKRQHQPIHKRPQKSIPIKPMKRSEQEQAKHRQLAKPPSESTEEEEQHAPPTHANHRH